MHYNIAPSFKITTLPFKAFHSYPITADYIHIDRESKMMTPIFNTAGMETLLVNSLT